MSRVEFLRAELAYLNGAAKQVVAALPRWERARADTMRLQDIALIETELSAATGDSNG